MDAMPATTRSHRTNTEAKEKETMDDDDSDKTSTPIASWINVAELTVQAIG